MVLVQEFGGGPPLSPVSFPDGTAYKPDKEAAAFFDSMKAHGFEYHLSEEDTGSGDKNHVNSPATEWWVVFFKPDRVNVADDLPGGFLATDRSNHEDYERVPYAFGLRTVTGGNDFVLISVHLQPNDSGKDTARRKTELESIVEWVDNHDEAEQDFFIVGDMNFKDCAEIAAITPAGLSALNSGPGCINTNVNPNGKPYDNVLFTASGGKELQADGGMEVINLVRAMSASWEVEFSQTYSPDVRKQRDDFRTPVFRPSSHRIPVEGGCG